jgi:putative endonuclease
VKDVPVKQYYVYILFNQSRTLYVGVTNDLLRRMMEHRDKLIPGFTAKYNITQLAYYEVHHEAFTAIEREKTIKGWRRSKKIALIESMNPHWDDLQDHLIEE